MTQAKTANVLFAVQLDVLGKDSGVRPYAIDPESAARLWTVSAELSGVNAFE